MGLLGIDKTSSKTEITTIDNRIAASDDAKVLRGQGNKTVIGGSGTVVNSKSTVGAGANTGVKFGNVAAGASQTINITDGGAASALFDKTTSAFQDALSGANLAVKDAVSSANSALSTVKDLAESNTTGGQNKTVLYIALGALALVAAFFYFRKK